MNRSTFVAAAAALGAVAGAQTPMWGISSNFFNNTVTPHVYLMNSSTGAAIQGAPITGPGGSAVSTSIVGAAVLNGTLYVSDAFANGGDFGSLNAVTGVFTPIGNQNGSVNWWALAPNPTAGVLYTVESDAGESYNGSLLSIDPTTGNPTVIGPTMDASGNQLQMNELAYDSNTSTLFGVGPSNNLYTIDPNTGISTLVGSTGLGASNTSDMTYDPTTDALYFNDGSSLYGINMTSGLATLIGSNGTGGATIDGLAAPSPEPSGLLAVGIGLGGVAFLRRRKRS